MLKVLLKVSSAYTLLTAELRPVLKVLLKVSSAYTLLTAELRQASVKAKIYIDRLHRSLVKGAAQLTLCSQWKTKEQVCWTENLF